MARQKYTITRLEAEDDLDALIAFHLNADLVTKRRAELKAAEDEAVKRINQIGDVDEIETLRLAAQHDRDEAARALDAARGKATDITRKAAEDAAAKKTADDARIKASEDAVSARELAVGKRERDAEKAAAEAEELGAYGQKQLELANSRMIDAKALQAENENRKRAALAAAAALG